MGSCDFCKVDPKEPLKSCVCKKVSYCSKECQVKDWKNHKPSCPPFLIRESPGKGRGLFATRNIKEGQVILEEYPLFTLPGPLSFKEFETNHFPNIGEETKAKIHQLYDPADNIKRLDTKTVEKLVSNDPWMMLWTEAPSDEISKIFRVFTGNSRRICVEEDLYTNTEEIGLYYTLSLIWHPTLTTGVLPFIGLVYMNLQIFLGIRQSRQVRQRNLPDTLL